MPHYTEADSEFEPVSNGTPLEAYLSTVHGDLHTVIPMLASTMTLKQTARELSDDKCSVSAGWLSWWLKENGYSRSYRWVRSDGGHTS